jgi:hypothetical protein
VLSGEYGTQPVERSVKAFRADFELICSNAQAFHRPNERCHVVAKNMLRFGTNVMEATFPWSIPADGDDAADQEGRPDAPKESGGESGRMPTLESPLHHDAAIAFELVDADTQSDTGGAAPSTALVAAAAAAHTTAIEHCLRCGGWSDPFAKCIEEAMLLRCNLCAESYHSYCTPAPCPEVNESTLLQWHCPRCVPLVTPSLWRGGEAPTDTQGEDKTEELAANYTRCARCDKSFHNRLVGECGKRGDFWVCVDCRCCEGCGARHAPRWSDDGLWCASCAPAGVEGRYCAVCALPYDNDGDDAAVMVQCDSCQLWVHPQCVGMDEASLPHMSHVYPMFPIDHRILFAFRRLRTHSTLRVSLGIPSSTAPTARPRRVRSARSSGSRSSDSSQESRTSAPTSLRSCSSRAIARRMPTESLRSSGDAPPSRGGSKCAPQRAQGGRLIFSPFKAPNNAGTRVVTKQNGLALRTSAIL